MNFESISICRYGLLSIARRFKKYHLHVSEIEILPSIKRNDECFYITIIMVNSGIGRSIAGERQRVRIFSKRGLLAWKGPWWSEGQVLAPKEDKILS